MHKLIIIALLLGVSSPVYAEKLAVLRGRHLVEMDDEIVPTQVRARRISEEIVAVAQEIGWEPVFIDQECSDRDCLKKVAELQSAMEAISVNISETDIDFEFECVLAKGQGFKSEKITLYKYSTLKIKVREMAEKLLKDALPSKPTEPTDSPKLDDKVEDGQDDQSDSVPTENNDGLQPPAFWTSLIITGGLAVVWGAMEITVYAKWKKLDGLSPDERTDSDWNQLGRLQVADRVLFGAALTGVVTTTVLAIFTDFKSEQEKKAALSPVFLENGGMIMFQGSF